MPHLVLRLLRSWIISARLRHRAFLALLGLGFIAYHTAPRPEIELLSGLPVLLASTSPALAGSQAELSPGERRALSTSVGIGSTLLSNLVSAVGMVVLRKSHLVRRQGPAAAARSRCRPRGWYIGGLAFYLAAVPFDVLGYALAPESVCTVLGGCKLIFVAILGRLFLGELLSRWDVVGIALCMTGSSVSIFATPEAHERHVDRAYLLFTPEVVAFLAVLVPAVVILAAVDWRADPARLWPTVRRYMLPFITAAVFSIEKLFNSMIGNIDFSSGAAAGGLVEWAWLPALLALLGLTDLFYNLRGAQRHCVSEFVPTVFVIGSSLQLFTAVVVLGERWASGLEACAAALGALTALFGVTLVSPKEEGLDGPPPGTANALELLPAPS